ncbi:MAG: tetratricopeptide repeat protein, partial [Candidatus Baldrarchaeia archaeon]
EKAIELNPNYAIAYYDLALAYGNEEQFHRYYKLPGQTFTQAGYPEMQEKYEKAVEYLELLEERFPEYKAIAEQALGDVNFLYYCGYVNREKYVLPHYLYALNHIDEVEKLLGKEGASALYANLARTYLAMAEVEKAEEYYEKAIEVYPDPGIDTAYEHLAWVELELGKIDEAYKVAKAFIERAEKYGWDSDLGLAPAMISSYLLGKYDEARGYAEGIIERFPESAYVGEAYRILAMISYQSGDKNKAMEMLEKDISNCNDAIKNPEDATTIPTAMYERALAYYLLYKYTNESTYLDKAISDFEWIVENPKQTKREVAHRNYYILAHLSLASIHSQKGEFDKAKQYINKLKSELNSDPNLQGWRKFIGSNVNMLAEKLESGEKIEMPEVVWILSH